MTDARPDKCARCPHWRLGGFKDGKRYERRWLCVVEAAGGKCKKEK